MQTADKHQSDQGNVSGALALLFEELPAAEVMAIRLAAIPLQLTRTRLALLVEASDLTTQTVDATWDSLQSLQLARLDGDEARLQAELRRALLIWWRTEEPDRFVALNRLLLNRLQDEPGQTTAAHAAELAYHWLIVDEPAGLAYLVEQVERLISYYQPGEAEYLITRAGELLPWLHESTQAWLDYADARIQSSTQPDAVAQATLTKLATDGPDPELRAAAIWTLGNIEVREQNWAAGIGHLRKALRLLSHARTSAYLPRVLLSLGDAYRDLAEQSNGLAVGALQRPPGSLVTRLVELPFRLYRLFVQDIAILPNWYFGGNYEDWIVAYLRKQAVAWYRQGERAAARLDAELVRVDAQLARARLLHRLGRRRQARRAFRQIANEKTITQSRYRAALLQLAVGEALAVEGRWSYARQQLQPARQTFADYADVRSAAVTEHWLARVAVMTDPDDVVPIYAASIRAYADNNDLTTATMALGELEDYARMARTRVDTAEIDGLRDELPTLQFVARFPASFLRMARRLALFVALPVSLLFGLLLTLAFTVTTVGQFEGITRHLLMSTSFARLSWVDVLILVLFSLSPLLALWLFHGLYTIVGFLLFSIVGRRVLRIEEELPDRFILNDRGIAATQTGSDATVLLAWTDHLQIVSAEHRWPWRTIRLLSRVFLTADGGSNITVNAVTVGYSQVRREIQRRLAERSEVLRYNFDFNLFARGALIAVGVLTVLALIYFAPHFRRDEVGVNQLDGSVVWLEVYAPRWLRNALLTAVPLYLTVTLWRLVWRRRQWQRVAPAMRALTTDWVLWVAAIILTAWTGAWILLLGPL